MYIPRDCWGELAEAIILQAVEDYRHIKARILKKPNDLRLQSQKEELEEFFLSSWFAVLTDLNGRRLLHRLQAETPVMEEKE